MSRFSMILAAALTVLAFPVSAANLQISPLGMTLTPQQKVESLRFKNAGTEPVRMQMRAFAWTQVAGETVETPTTNVQFGPTMFVIPPGGTQVVRVIRTAPTQPTEQTYRIVAAELPGVAMTETGAQFLLNYNLPLFYRPAGAQPALTATWEGSNLVVSNTGQATAQLAALTINGEPENAGLVGYVLPGSTVRIPVNKTGASVGIKVNGEAKSWSVK